MERQKLPKQGWNQIISSSTTDSLKRLFTNKIFVINVMAASLTLFVFSGFGTFLPKFYQVIYEILKLGPQFYRIHFYYVIDLVPFPGFLIKYRNIGPHSWSTSGNGSIWFCAIQISSQGCLGPSMECAGRLMYGCWPFHKFADCL